MALALLAAACTSGAEGPTTTSPPPTAPPPTTTTPPPPTTTTPPPLAPLVTDRLVVVDARNAVVTMDRDGANPVTVSEGSDLPFQPIWSPDASSIAFSVRSATPEFVVIGADGENRRSAARPTPSFYFYWSPDGRQLGSLRNSPAGLVLDIVRVAADALTVEAVDGGQPFYFSWSPDSTQFIAHVGTDRIDVVDASGNRRALGPEPGVFQAPQWTPEGIVAIAGSGSAQQLAMISPEGVVEEISTADGGVIFSASPNGDLIAAQTFAAGGNSISVALRAEPLPPNRLYVIDIASGELTAVTEGPAAAFFWSPVLDRLLVLEAADAPGEIRASVWDQGVLHLGPNFLPEPRWLAEFLPFYDQYAQSVSLWAPDASAYAFPGAVDRTPGIWVTPYRGGEPLRVSDGYWVAWSPD